MRNVVNLHVQHGARMINRGTSWIIFLSLFFRDISFALAALYSSTVLYLPCVKSIQLSFHLADKREYDYTEKRIKNKSVYKWRNDCTIERNVYQISLYIQILVICKNMLQHIYDNRFLLILHRFLYSKKKSKFRYMNYLFLLNKYV